MDQTTELLSSYACNLNFEDLGPEVVHQVKRTLIDTLGCAAGGFSSEPATIARRLAANVASATPSRVLGTGDAHPPTWRPSPTGSWYATLTVMTPIFPPEADTPVT